MFDFTCRHLGILHGILCWIPSNGVLLFFDFFGGQAHGTQLFDKYSIFPFLIGWENLITSLNAWWLLTAVHGNRWICPYRFVLGLSLTVVKCQFFAVLFICFPEWGEDWVEKWRRMGILGLVGFRFAHIGLGQVQYSDSDHSLNNNYGKLKGSRAKELISGKSFVFPNVFLQKFFFFRSFQCLFEPRQHEIVKCRRRLYHCLCRTHNRRGDRKDSLHKHIDKYVTFANDLRFSSFLLTKLWW